MNKNSLKRQIESTSQVGLGQAKSTQQSQLARLGWAGLVGHEHGLSDMDKTG